MFRLIFTIFVLIQLSNTAKLDHLVSNSASSLQINNGKSILSVNSVQSKRNGTITNSTIINQQLLPPSFLKGKASPTSLTTTIKTTVKPKARNPGKYQPEADKWAYKPDNSGKYVHVHVPYNGGYGPWVIKGLNPYDHDGRPYEHDDHPFKNQFYNDPKPAVYREYGAPLFNNH